VASKLERLEQAARGADNLLPLILDAAGSYATVGEISHRLKMVFGEYRES
jgi:methylmalonyl-CoA mutase N-terminal domain/subunit